MQAESMPPVLVEELMAFVTFSCSAVRGIKTALVVLQSETSMNFRNCTEFPGLYELLTC